MSCSQQHGDPLTIGIWGGAPLKNPNSYLIFPIVFGVGGGPESGIFDTWFSGYVKVKLPKPYYALLCT